VFEVALEIGGLEDGEESTMAYSGDMWDTVLALTRSSASSPKRKSLEPPTSDTPHCWEYYTAHKALSNLLDGAVSHKDLELRTIYIERIMSLTAETQRVLMSLIEKRKRRNRTTGTPGTKRVRRHTFTPTKKTPLKKTTPNEKRRQFGSSNSRSPFTPIDRKRTKAADNITPKSTERGQVLIDEKADKRLGRTPSMKIVGAHMDTPGSEARPTLNSNNFHGSLFSPGLGDTKLFEQEVRSLREQNEELTRKLEKSKTVEEKLNEKLDELDSNFKKEMIKAEVEAQRKLEEQNDALQQEVTDLQSKLGKLSHQYAMAEHAQKELAGMKDEMDLLAHTKTMFTDTSERLRNAKEKLQQLTDVKDALEREEQAHAKSVQECIRLENELQNMIPLKHQLQEYKERAANAEVKTSELQDELTKLKEQRLCNSDSNDHLRNILGANQDEIVELRRRLADGNIADEDVASNGLGEGMSELNPDVKEELFRLRHENLKLRDFFEKRQDDSVSKLEKECEDQSLLHERYKDQFLSTKNQLESTLDTLQDSRDRESKLRTDLSVSMEKTKQAQNMVEEVSKQLARTTETLNASTGREAKLENELSAWVDQTKSLQEELNDLTSEQHKNATELELCQSREGDLKQEQLMLEKELNAAESKGEKLENALNQCQADLQSSQQHQMHLRDQVKAWKDKVSLAEARRMDTQNQLTECRGQLASSQGAFQQVQSQLVELTDQKEKLDSQVNYLKQSLTNATDVTVETRNALSSAKEENKRLETELVDMVSRVEDAETVSKQRLELVQSTREKLKATRSEVDALEEQDEKNASIINSLREEREHHISEIALLEDRLAQAQHDLIDTKDELQGSKRAAEALKAKNEEQTGFIDEWKAKAEGAEKFVDKLQDELAKTRELLLGTQQKLQTSKSNEAYLEDELSKTENTIHGLEQQLATESSARKALQQEIKDAWAGVASSKSDIEEMKASFLSQIEEERRLLGKQKQDLFVSQESLSQVKGLLGSSEHREKMLELQIGKLRDEREELQRQVQSMEDEKIAVLAQSELSWEAKREELISKREKDMNELQVNMNSLLEDERRAKRQVEEMYQKEIQDVKKGIDQELDEVKNISQEELQLASKQYDEKLCLIKQDYELKLSDLRIKADNENEQLLEKGKGMLKDVRSKAKEELNSLREDFAELEGRLEEERKEKQAHANQFKAKLIEYKKKLQFATNRVSSLTMDTDELEEKVQLLERQQFKLQEENDQYRRQLGGRYGPDSKVQGQLEFLQKEFKVAMEETRELRKKLKQAGAGTTSFSGLSSINEGRDDEDMDRSYSRDAVNQSTLVQLRTEYEDTIEALNDEKRELVMKNSVAITDVQKAEKRAWESEKENENLKHEMASLNLQVERLEHMLSSAEENEGGSVSVYPSLSEVSSVPKPPTTNPPLSEGIEEQPIAATVPSTDSVQGILSPSKVGNSNDYGAAVRRRQLVSKSPFLAKQSPIQTVAAPNSQNEESSVFPSLERSNGEAPPECRQS